MISLISKWSLRLSFSPHVCCIFLNFHNLFFYFNLCMYGIPNWRRVLLIDLKCEQTMTYANIKVLFTIFWANALNINAFLSGLTSVTKWLSSISNNSYPQTQNTSCPQVLSQKKSWFLTCVRKEETEPKVTWEGSLLSSLWKIILKEIS